MYYSHYGDDDGRCYSRPRPRRRLLLLLLLLLPLLLVLPSSSSCSACCLSSCCCFFCRRRRPLLLLGQVLLPLLTQPLFLLPRLLLPFLLKQEGDDNLYTCCSLAIVDYFCHCARDSFTSSSVLSVQPRGKSPANTLKFHTASCRRHCSCEVWVLREYKEIEPIILSVGEEDEAIHTLRRSESIGFQRTLDRSM